MICFFIYNPTRKEYVGENGSIVSSYHDAQTWPTFKYLKIFLGDIIRFAQINKLDWYANAFICEIQDKEKTVYKPVINLLWHEYWLLKNDFESAPLIFKENSLKIVESLKGTVVPEVGTVKLPDIWS